MHSFNVNRIYNKILDRDWFSERLQSGTVIKIDNLEQNNLLANQTPSLGSRDTSS